VSGGIVWCRKDNITVNESGRPSIRQFRRPEYGTGMSGEFFGWKTYVTSFLETLVNIGNREDAGGVDDNGTTILS